MMTTNCSDEFFNHKLSHQVTKLEKALHRYHRGMGLSPLQASIILQVPYFQMLKLKNLHYNGCHHSLFNP